MFDDVHVKIQRPNYMNMPALVFLMLFNADKFDMDLKKNTLHSIKELLGVKKSDYVLGKRKNKLYVNN